jgi:hypothetical protein
MLKKDPNYQRLKAGRRGVFGQSSYWLGANHLLVVEVANYVERYRRFYYSDVQAIVVQHSNLRLWTNLVLGFFTFAALAIGVLLAVTPLRNGFTEGDYIAVGVWLGVALLFAVFLLVNTLRGPTCSVHVRTAVQTQKLSGLSRWRAADTFVAALQPLIVAAQGQLAPDEMWQRLQQSAAEAGSVAVTGAGAELPPVAPSPPTPPPRRHYQSKMHAILFWLLLADGPLTLLHEWLEADWMNAVGVVVLLVTMGFAIAAAVRQHNTDLPGLLKFAPWWVLGFLGVFVLGSGAHGVWLAMNSQTTGGSSGEGSLALAMTLISTTANVALGVLGLLRLRRFQADYLQTQRPPPIIGAASP